MKSARERLARWIDESFATLGLAPRSAMGWLLALAIVVPPLAQLTYYAALNADTRAVIGGRDDDASNAIDIAGHSHWYSSNGFYPYGPLYFRVAHTLGANLAPLSEPGTLPVDEARSKAMHFALELTSVLCLFGLAVLLAGAWTNVWWARLALGAWVLWALLRTEVWQTFMLRAHPDHLLALTVALASWATARAWREDTGPTRRLAAWAWGLALSVKMTLLMWLPFLVLTLALPWRPGRVRELARFAAHAAGVFFLVGFPQNFSLHKIFRFLRQQSSLSLPATQASVTEWIGAWGAQVAWPAATLVIGLTVAYVLSPRDRRVRLDWRPFALGLGPFAVLMMQNVVAPHEHYPMPVVATQLALIAGVAGVRRLTSERTLLALTFASLVAFSILPVVPERFGSVLTAQLTCRTEARAVAARVNALRARGKTIHADPYAPIMSHLAGVKSTWQMSDEYLGQNHFDALVLSWPFANRYLEAAPSEYTKRDNPEWARAAKVYSLFKDRDVVDDAGGGRFTRTMRDACGWEIWEREGAR